MVRRRGRGDSQSCHAHTILKPIDNMKRLQRKRGTSESNVVQRAGVFLKFMDIRAYNYFADCKWCVTAALYRLGLAHFPSLHSLIVSSELPSGDGIRIKHRFLQAGVHRRWMSDPYHTLRQCREPFPFPASKSDYIRLRFHAGEIKKVPRGNSPSHLCAAFMGGQRVFAAKSCNPLACCSRAREDITMRNKGDDSSSVWNAILQRAPHPIPIPSSLQIAHITHFHTISLDSRSPAVTGHRSPDRTTRATPWTPLKATASQIMASSTSYQMLGFHMPNSCVSTACRGSGPSTGTI